MFNTMKNTNKLIGFIKELGLKNAVKHNGNANPNAIIGSVLKEFPESRKNIQEIRNTIVSVVNDINKLSLDKQKKELLSICPQFFNKSQEKKGLKDLPNVDKYNKIIMRFAPSPSGPMHIGHVFSGMPTSLYTKKYDGKFIFRIEDTNPDNIDPNAYTMLKEDADWVFGNVDEYWIQSERITIYYNYAVKLIETGKAYVCTCDNEDFKKKIWSKQECECRKLSVDENIERWNKMLNPNGFEPGEAVLRFKGNINHKNPALRDFPLARINLKKHPLQDNKFRVWPLMNLSVAVDDIEAGMTHIIRAKDHQTNAIRQKMIYDALGIKNFPETLFLGRWNFEGLELSSSKTRKLIEQGVFSGWDDIRLPFLRALKRRGYQPDAFKRFVEEVGITKNDKKMSVQDFFKALNAYNKEIVDKTSKRFFFIQNPVKIHLELEPFKVELDFHPDNIKGGRSFNINGDFFIEKKDNIEGFIRLMDCLNYIKSNDKYEFISKNYEDFKTKGKRIIHWLTCDNNVNVEVLMPDASTVKGIAENTIKILKTGDIIQFERFGFCRLDSIDNNTYKFWFLHK